MRAHLKTVGKGAVPQMLDNGSYTGFANWRWTTLLKCLLGVEPILDTFISNVPPHVFASLRNQSHVSKAAEVVHSPTWKDYFRIALWFTDLLCDIQSWGGGADEPPSDGDNETHNERMKGRRMRTAYAYAIRTFEQALQTASTWNVSDF